MCPPSLNGELCRLQILCCGIHFSLNLSTFWITVYMWTQEQEEKDRKISRELQVQWILNASVWEWNLFPLHLKYFTFILFSLFVCVCVGGICAEECRCLPSPEESDSLEQVFQVVVSFPTVVGGTRCVSSARVICSYACLSVELSWAVSPEAFFLSSERIQSQMTKHFQVWTCSTVSHYHLVLLSAFLGPGNQLDSICL